MEPNEKLRCFMYILLRDYLPIGYVNEIINKYCSVKEKPVYSDSMLYSMASKLIDKLSKNKRGE